MKNVYCLFYIILHVGTYSRFFIRNALVGILHLSSQLLSSTLIHMRHTKEFYFLTHSYIFC